MIINVGTKKLIGFFGLLQLILTIIFFIALEKNTALARSITSLAILFGIILGKWLVEDYIKKKA